MSGPVLVGYSLENRGRASLALGRLLAVSSSRQLEVVCVIPERWAPISPARAADRQYHEYLRKVAEASLGHARDFLAGSECEIGYDIVTARSAPAGLTQAAGQAGAWVVVTGSSTHGAWGRISLGSTNDRMLHSSTVPVALSPRGQRYGDPGATVSRVTAAVDGTSSSDAVLLKAARIAGRVGAGLRVVSFAVRPRTMFPPELGLHVEDGVLAAWREQAVARIRQSVARLDEQLECDPVLHISEGTSWAGALDEPGWLPGEVLVIGSSNSESRVRRVFLGSTATRIIRESPVPVIVVP